MKKFSFAIAASLSLGALSTYAQTTKVMLENDKIRITEFISQPGEDVCGKGTHTHGDHTTILLTDAQVKTVQADKTVVLETYLADKHLYRAETDSKVSKLETDGVFWVKGTTHSVTNAGNKPMRFYIVETK